MNAKARKVEHLVAKFANERRADRGLDRLDSDRALTSAAREHSRWMAKTGNYRHFRDSGDGVRGGGPSDRVNVYDEATENCHQIFGWNRSPRSIAAEALDGWMTSKGHRENILKADHVRQGVGVWRNGDAIYLTQMFVPHWATDDPKYRPKRAGDDLLANLERAVVSRLPFR